MDRFQPPTEPRVVPLNDKPTERDPYWMTRPLKPYQVEMNMSDAEQKLSHLLLQASGSVGMLTALGYTTHANRLREFIDEAEKVRSRMFYLSLRGSTL